MEPYIINQTGDQLQSILNKAIIKAELQTTEDGNQAIRFTASDGTSISVTLPEWSKRIEYLLQNTYYLQEGIGCAAFDYAMSLGDVPIQSEEVTRQEGDSIILDTSANRFVLERSGRFYTKFLSNGASMQGSDVYASRRNTFLNRQDKSYWYRKEDGTLTKGSSTFVIGNWLKTLQSECDSTQETAETARTVAQGANTTATEAKEAAAALLQDIQWGGGRHMNVFIEKGDFHIHGERTDANDGLPILNAGTIDARLTVLDSSLTRGTGEKTDIVVTQILRLSNRMGGDGHVYVRTAQAATKSQLATPSSTAWGTWEKLMGMFEKNAVKNIADLDTYTTNGMYSGLFADTTLQTLGGLQFTPGDTFLLITVNGYAASAFGTPQLTQMLYRLPAKKGSGNSSARMYMRTAYWDQNAEPNAWVWANWDRLAMASEISGGGGGSIEEYNRLIELIAANTEKISSVESTANSAKSAAETAQTAANAAQETANSARETATAASTAVQEAKTAAETAQSTATAAQTKNTEQDARLDNIEARIDPDIAGRVWNEDNGTPKAESYYGSVKALRDLPKRLGLGRYLVKDDRTRRKLDPNDSTKYLDGTPAALDGTDGQCMWCWNGFYANIWHEGSRLIKAVTFDGPVGNDISIWIPAGGISWLGAGVIDRGDAPYTDKTKWKLCSVINNSEQFRGGGGTALDASKYTKAPSAESPQISMLGMPATNISTTNFGTYARKRGEGWEANWFVARFVVEFLFEIIMGTENSQEAFNANKDANGLYQGGFGTGVTNMPEWNNYNGLYPVIPTSVGLEAGDGVCLVDYKLPQTNGVDGDTYKTFNVPVFFGLVGAGFGNLCQWTRGLIMDGCEEKSLVYVAPSMYAAYDPNTVENKIMVEECPRVSGYITRKSYRGLCCMPTEIGGSTHVRYSDYFSTDAKPLRARAAGGDALKADNAGESFSFTNNDAARVYSFYTSPLCYFTEDTIIPDSQSIANNIITTKNLQ